MKTGKNCGKKILSVDRIFDEKSNKTMQEIMEDAVKIILQNQI